MEQYIDKAALVAEIERRYLEDYNTDDVEMDEVAQGVLASLKYFINTLEVKEVKEPASTAYVVTRCEEHSDYVEEVFFNEDKAQEYCDQFKGKRE